MAVIHVNKENFEKEIEKSKLIVVIDFHATWCGPCQMMSSVFESLSNEYKNRLKFAKINTDENPDLAEKFEIQSIPCIVSVKNSKEIDRITGFFPEGVLRKKMDEIIKKN